EASLCGWQGIVHSFEERIIQALVAKCGRLAVAGDDERVIVECHELLLNRSDDLGIRTAPEIGASDALRKQCVARKENVAVPGEMEARTAGRVARRMDDPDFHAAAGDGIAVLNKMINLAAFR